MYGHYDAVQAQNLMIVFEGCNSTERTCKNETEVKEWLKFRYIAMIQNRRSFIQYEFGDEKFMEQSELKFLPMSFER